MLWMSGKGWRRVNALMVALKFAPAAELFWWSWWPKRALVLQLYTCEPFTHYDALVIELSPYTSLRRQLYQLLCCTLGSKLLLWYSFEGAR